MTPKHIIPRLLSRRDRLSRPEQEEILAHVLAEVRLPRGRATLTCGWRGLLWTGAAASVVTLALVVWWTWGPGVGTREAEPPQFASRGAPAPSLSARCVDATGIVPCRQGGKLAFEIVTTPELRYLSAFSRRADGTVIWYFPEAGGRARDLAGALVHGLFHTGVALGAEHTPGSHQVHAIFSTTPLSRDEVRAVIDPPRAGAARPAPRAVVRTATVLVR